MIEAYSDKLLQMSKDLLEMRVDMYEQLHKDEDWEHIKSTLKMTADSLGGLAVLISEKENKNA